MDKEKIKDISFLCGIEGESVSRILEPDRTAHDLGLRWRKAYTTMQSNIDEINQYVCWGRCNEIQYEGVKAFFELCIKDIVRQLRILSDIEVQVWQTKPYEKVSNASSEALVRYNNALDDFKKTFNEQVRIHDVFF